MLWRILKLTRVGTLGLVFSLTKFSIRSVTEDIGMGEGAIVKDWGRNYI